MKRYLYMAGMLILSMQVHSQIIQIEATTKEGQSFLVDRIQQQEYLTQKTDHLINYHPTVSTTLAPIEISLGDNNFNQCNIYTVYQPASHGREELIWNIESDQQDRLALTNRRAVDYTKGKFMNFVDLSPLDAQINSYEHYQNEFPGNKLVLGGLPNNQKIPVNQYQGEIAEMIVFDKSLAPIAKQQVESYLALKYSIPLAINIDYIDSNAEILWNANKNKKHSFRVAGLGTDYTTGLHQKQSRSELGAGSISIGIESIKENNRLNPNSLADQEYLLWSDDNGLIDYEIEEGKNPTISREWKLHTKRFQSTSALVFQLDHEGIINDLLDDEYLWLTIDASGSNQYLVEDSKHVLLEQNKGRSQSKPFSLTNNSDHHFKLTKAPKMWAAMDLEMLDCETENGRVKIKAVGGKAPFQVSLTSTGYSKELSIQTNESIVQLNDLSMGKYTLNISDTNGDEWTKEFYLNASEIPTPEIQTVFIIEDGIYPTIDASLKMPADLEYEWTSESIKNSVQGGLLQPNTSGIYTLKVTDENCTLLKDIRIKIIENNILNLSLNPNPSSTGYFTLSAQLKEATPYTISVYDMEGKLISSQDYSKEKYIQQNDWIQRSGTYLISLTSGSSIETRKLVVLK